MNITFLSLVKKKKKIVEKSLVKKKKKSPHSYPLGNFPPHKQSKAHKNSERKAWWWWWPFLFQHPSSPPRNPLSTHTLPNFGYFNFNLRPPSSTIPIISKLDDPLGAMASWTSLGFHLSLLQLSIHLSIYCDLLFIVIFFHFLWQFKRVSLGARHWIFFWRFGRTQNSGCWRRQRQDQVLYISHVTPFKKCRLSASGFW